jgi:hypothetical protein
MLLSLLLSGCTGFLNRSYSAQTPHTQFSDEDKNPDILRADTYQGLVSALLFLISEGEEEGSIRLYDYKGLPEQDVDKACLEVTQQDPLGAYAVDYIKSDISRVMTYYEAKLKIVYKRSWQQISNVSSVTGSSAIIGELREVLANFQEEKVLRVNYFDPNMKAVSVVSMVEEAYYDVPESAFGKPSVQVQLYPETAVGQQRLVEILLKYPEPEELLKVKQKALLKQSKTLTKSLAPLSEPEKRIRVVQALKETAHLVPKAEGTSNAYDALVNGEADGEGMTLAAELLFKQSGLQSRIVRGSKNGEPRFWTMVQVEGQWQHLDVTVDKPKPQGDKAMREAGYLWSGDFPVCQEVTVTLP